MQNNVKKMSLFFSKTLTTYIVANSYKTNFYLSLETAVKASTRNDAT